MADALSRVGTRNVRTPQNRRANPREVQNNAGGYVYEVSDVVRLHRFLTIGTEGGTFYVKQRDLTRNNAGVVIKMAIASDKRLLDAVFEISTEGRAPRNNPALFALAAAAGLGSVEYRQKALDMLPVIARTGSHLLTFAGYAEQFRGWGPQLVKAVGRWYTANDADTTAYQLLKYKQRNAWSQRDLLRLSHFGRRPLEAQQKALFSYVMKGEVLPELASMPLVTSAAAAHATRNVRDWVSIIEDNRSLSWEMLPSEALAQADVWRALLLNGNMPPGAILRELPRLTRLGVLQQMNEAVRYVKTKLTDPKVLAKARIHPISVLLAMKTYASGRGVQGRSTWTPVPQVISALDEGFYQAFGSVEPSGKRVLVALDVSGSMGMLAGGLPLTCREVTAAMSMVVMKTESEYGIVGFSHQLVHLPLTPDMRLDTVTKAIAGLPFGATDCSLPMIWARQNKIEVDTFQTWTDNETWAGYMHPHEALEEYRQSMGIDARMQVAAITPTKFSIADPLDARQLDVSGFDSAVPRLLADHGRGDL